MCLRHRVRGGSRSSAAAWASVAGNGVPLSAPNVRMTAAATPMSKALAGSNGYTSWAAFTKIRCASAADPRLTSMCPRRRAMSPSSNGSLAPSRAAESNACACPARPHAQALRAAAKVSSARLTWSPQSAAARSYAASAATYPPRRCARLPTSSSAPTTSWSGPSAADARCHASRSGSRVRTAPRRGPDARPALRPVAAW